MKTVTVTLDKETVAWARACAQRNISLSRFVGELLQKQMGESREYEEAMRRFLSKGPFKALKGPTEHYLGREELRERSRIR